MLKARTGLITMLGIWLLTCAFQDAALGSAQPEDEAIHRAIDRLLVPSRLFAEGMRHMDNLENPTAREIWDAVDLANQGVYPNLSGEALEARRELLLHGPEIIPVLLGVAAKQDSDSWEGVSAAACLNSLLEEVTGCSTEWELEAAPHGGKVGELVEGWSRIWDLWQRRTSEELLPWEKAIIDQIQHRDDNPRPRRAEASVIDEPDFGRIFLCEQVMNPGEEITFEGPEGTMTVAAGLGYERTYKWEGHARTVILTPRIGRWNYSLGLYCPGSGNHWADADGIKRGVLEECVIHFPGQEPDAMQPIPDHGRVGLVTDWSKTPSRNQLNVEIWQTLWYED